MIKCEKCGCACHCASNEVFVKSCEECGCVGCQHEKA